jgi:low affinity Fe/Cu permease
MKILRHLLTRIGALTSRPIAFAIVIAYAALWAAFDRETPVWHGAATMATWLMTLFIQRAEHRDTQAIHAKLDELLRAETAADDTLRDIDDEEPEEIEHHRSETTNGADKTVS